MSVAKNTVMLKADSKKFLLAMAEAELEPKELAEKSGVPVNIVYIMRRGFYVKPKYIGAVSRILNVSVADLVEDVDNEPEQAAAT